MRRAKSWGTFIGAKEGVPDPFNGGESRTSEDQNVPTVQGADSLFYGARNAQTPGCDSSDCSYCQSVARTRQMHGRSPQCWLRKKRSESELAGLGSFDDGNINTTSGMHRRHSSSLLVVPDVEELRQPSIWDHALLEPDAAQRAIDAQAERALINDITPRNSMEKLQPWSSDPSWASQPHPEPAVFQEIARFSSSPSPKDRCQSADITCSIEFEEHGWLLATAGVAKQIRLYSLASYLESPSNECLHAPIRVHRMSSKLSSLAWNPDQPGVVTVGDYDGVVSQVDLESGHLVAEADEHCGRRIWSVSHSHFHSHLAASASDDGTARIWQGPGLDHVAAAVRPGRGASVCSVHFSSFDSNLLALGCADSAAYVYDLRRLKAPLACLRSHTRPVAYARFMGHDKLVTSSIDGTLAVWNLPVQGNLPSVMRRCRGHTNAKNFVGLSVRADQQLVACGSEHPSAYAYSLNWEQPLVEHCFVAPNGVGAIGTASPTGASDFCSAVSWQPEVANRGREPLLAAATSEGTLRMLALKRLVDVPNHNDMVQ